MKPTELDRSGALDAVHVLNDLVGDFVTGVMVFLYFQERYKAGLLSYDQMVGVQKMCLSHLALALCKCAEFWQKYHRLVAAEHAEPFKGIVRAIQNRKIEDFRNQYVGHIWNKHDQRPLRPSEVMERLYRLSPDETVFSFLGWINKPGENTYPNTVVGIVEKVRDDIQARFSINPKEVVNR